MATTYNTAFGSLPGYNEMLGTTNTTGGGQQQTYGQTTQTTTTRPPAQAGQTFAQLQRQGMARPAPPTAPQAQPFAQYGGSQQAQQMRQRLQQQLEQFGQAPSRFGTAEFQQVRGAQAANLQAEYRAQQQQLNEELARRGLSASSVGGGRMGDLAGQQARALATLDAELLQRAAETQAQDRAQLLAASQGLAELASAQDLQQFEANRVAQAATFENQLRAAQFGQQQFEAGGAQALQGAQAEQAARQFQQELGLRMGEMTGQIGGAQTLAARQQAEQQRQFNIEQGLRQVLGLGGLQIQQAGLTGQFGGEQTLAAQQLEEQQRQFNAQQLLAKAGITGTLEGQQTLEAKQQDLQKRQVAYQQAAQQSQQSGYQYTVDTDGNVIPLKDAQGNLVRTSDFTQAQEARKQQAEQFMVSQFGVQTPGADAQTLAAKQQEMQQRQMAYQQAQQLSQQSGTQYTVGDDGKVTQVTGPDGLPVKTSEVSQADLARKQQDDQFKMAQFGTTTPTANQQTLAALQQATQVKQQAYQQAMALSEQSGKQYTVSDDGKVVPLFDKDGNLVATNDAAQAALNRDQQSTQFNLTNAIQKTQQAYQQALALSQQSGVQYQVDEKGNVVMALDAKNNPLPTSDVSQAALQREQQNAQFMISQFGKAGAIQTGTQTLAALQQQLQQAGVTGKFEGQLTQEALQNAYARAAQLTQATGQQYTVDPATGAITAGGSTLEARLREAGITGTFGGALTQEALQNAYARAAQLSQITGQQYTVDPKDGKIVAATGEAGRTFAAQLQAAGITGQFGGALTQDALQNAYARAAQLTQATGLQHTVNPATGAITAGGVSEQASLQRAELTGQLGGVDTIARRQLAEQQRQANIQQAQFLTQQTGNIWGIDETQLNIPVQLQGLGPSMASLDQKLRQALGMSEATGYVYDPTTGQMVGPRTETVQGQIARSQILMALAQSLGNLTPDQIAQLLGRNPGATTTQAGRSEDLTTTTRSSELRDTPTTQPGATTTTPAGTTTTRTGTTTTQPTGPLPSNVLSAITSYYTNPFEGMYANASTMDADYFAQYRNGTWVAVSPPPTQRVQAPDGDYQIPVYPGYQHNTGNGIFRWNGTQWVRL